MVDKLGITESIVYFIGWQRFFLINKAHLADQMDHKFAFSKLFTYVIVDQFGTLVVPCGVRSKHDDDVVNPEHIIDGQGLNSPSIIPSQCAGCSREYADNRVCSVCGCLSSSYISRWSDKSNRRMIN